MKRHRTDIASWNSLPGRVGQDVVLSEYERGNRLRYHLIRRLSDSPIPDSSCTLLPCLPEGYLLSASETCSHLFLAVHPFLLSYRALIVTLVAVLMLAMPFASAGASMAPVPIGSSAVGDREESEEHCDEEADGCCESAEAADDCSEGGDCGPECGGGCLCCLSTALLLAGDSIPAARPIDSHPAPARSGPISSGDPLPFDRPPC